MEKNPRSASDVVTVFLDTTLDTHLAMTVSGNDTVSELKRKLENEHQLCMGEIKIRSLKVNRRGCFYHLSDSMCVTGAVSGVDKECFLFADASSLEKNGEIQHGSHNFGSNNQFVCFGISDRALVNGMDRPSDVPSKSLCNVDDSIPLLLEGNKHNIADQNGSVDSGRETSKDLEMGIKHSDEDHCRTSFNETTHRPEPEIREDRSLSNDGFRVPTTQEHKEDTSRKDVSEAKSIATLEKASPAKNGQKKDKQKCEETVHLNENDAPVHGFNEEQSQLDIVPPENSLGNESRDVSCDTMIESKDSARREVPCDSVIGEKSITEEPCRPSASNMDNRSGSGILRTNDAYKEAEVSEKHTKCRQDSHCNTAVEDVSISQPALKKKHKFEEVTDLEDSLKENNILICDSNEEASKPEIASELSAEKNASTMFDGSLAETSDLLTSSSSRKKMTKKKKSLNALQLAVDAAPSRRGAMEERSVASSGINDKNSGGEVAASINRQDLKENHCAAIQELQENHKVPSSHDVNSATTDAGNVEHKSGASEEKSDGHPPMVVKAPCEGGTNSAERVHEENKSLRTNDSETMLSEKLKLPGHGKRYGNDAKVIEASELLDTNGTVTPSKKKRKRKKIMDSIEESLIISGAEHIIASECDISLVLSEKLKLPGHGKRYGNDAKVIEASELLDTNGTVTPSKKKRKRKKIMDSIEESLIISGAEHIIASECDISLAEPHETVYGEQVSDKAKKLESNISQNNGKDMSEKDTGHCHLVMEADNLDGNELETLQQIAVSTKKKSKRKHDAMTKDLHKLEAKEENVNHQHPALTSDNRTEALTSQRKKSKLAKTTPIDQSNEKCLESGKEYGVQIDTLRACSNSMSVSAKVPSHAPKHISEGTSLEGNLSGNDKEVSCEGEEINFHKYMVPSQSQNEVVASGEMHAEEVTRSKIADNKLKPKKNRKMLDSSSRSSDLQSPLKSHDNQGIGGKSEAGKSSSIQPQGSISKDGGVVPEPEKTVPKKVSKSGTKALSSDASGKKNLIPKAAGKHSVANGSGAKTLSEERNEAVSLSNSKTEKSNNKDQSKTGKKRESGVTQNVVASGKASGIDNGEVLNSSKNKKSSATSVAPDDRNGIVEGKVGVVDSDASTTSSDYALSSESDYSDGESNAGSCASSGKQGTGRSGYSGIKGKPARRLKNDEIFLNSSVYKKAKLAASQSQQEEDSQAPEFVPDSQPVF